jgi:clan AA aspartic protease
MVNMGLVYAEIELTRSDDLALVRAGHLPETQIRHLQVRALVDSGATMLAIPASIKTQLNLDKLADSEAELADGSTIKLEVVGPVEVRFQNRRTTVEALVIPNETEVLLGAIPMEGMDVLIDPKRERLVVNPESPNMTRMILK